jgi:hypothetical protein
MKLAENWHIKQDAYNVILEQLVDVEDRKTKEMKKELKVVGYFGKLEHACDYVLRQNISEFEASNITSLIDTIRSESKRLQDVVRGLK